MSTAKTTLNREGFTLVEIVIAMMILSTILATIAGLTFKTARRSLDSQGMEQRQAAMMQDVNMLSAIPFDSLANFTGCTTISVEPFPYTRCVTRTVINANITRMQIIIRPTRANVWAPDTMWIDRTGTPINPLNTAM